MSSLAQVLIFYHFYFISVDADQCTQVTCMNGGTCVGRGDVFECICPPEYSGDLCERSKYIYAIPSKNAISANIKHDR